MIQCHCMEFSEQRTLSCEKKNHLAGESGQGMGWEVLLIGLRYIGSSKV